VTIAETREVPISVLMCVHNAGVYLREAIDSILTQSFSDFELVIVLDCPTDGSEKIVEAYDDPRIKIVRNSENLGLTQSLNKGLGQCLGQFIARHDADDISDKSRLRAQWTWLNAHSEIGLLGTDCLWIDSKGNPIRETTVRPKTHSEILWYMQFENPFVHSSVMFRRALVEELGGYDISYRRTQDFDLWSRVSMRSKVAILPEKLVKLRRHSSSISSQQAAASDFYSDGICKRVSEQVGIPEKVSKVLRAARHSVVTEEDLLELKSFKNAFRDAKKLAKKSLGEGLDLFARRHYAQLVSDLARKLAGKKTSLSFSFLVELALTDLLKFAGFPFHLWLAKIVLGNRRTLWLKKIAQPR
jgi:glycosyltransferase involved in cell wall biosynthesis